MSPEDLHCLPIIDELLVELVAFKRKIRIIQNNFQILMGMFLGSLEYAKVSFLWNKIVVMICKIQKSQEN